MAVIIKANNNFAPVVKRFKDQARPILDSSLRLTVSTSAKAAMQEARSNLKAMVYAAPLPRSVQEGHWTEQSYLDKRRLGIVWNAIKTTRAESLGVGIWLSTTRVDWFTVAMHPYNEESYYYAWVLNKGTTNKMNYTGRPFWIDMVRIMRMRLREMGMLGLRNAKMGLSGQMGWEFYDTATPL